MRWEGSFDGRALGRLLRWFAFFVLVATAAILLLVYLRLSGGQLPFTFHDVSGFPPWLPFLMYVIGLAGSIAAPKIVGRIVDRRVTFYDLAAANRRNSLFLALATVFGTGLTAYVLFTVVSLHASVGLVASLIATGAAVALAIGASVAGDRIVLAVSNARPVDEMANSILANVVQEMAVAADVPPPKLYLMDVAAPNAFSIGWGPSEAAIVVTRGLLERLDREELQAVIAHEMAHIRNLDTRYGQFVSVLVGTTVLIADGFFGVVTFPFRKVGDAAGGMVSHAIDGGSGGSGRTREVRGSGSGGSWSFPDIDLGGDSDSGGSAAILVIIAVVLFVLMIIIVAWIAKALAPLITRLIQVAASQEREYLADATAVELGRNPHALERALATVASSPEVLPAANRSTAPLYFVNPIRRFEPRADSIWSTHPPTVDRINRLRALGGLAPLDAAAGTLFQEDTDQPYDPDAERRASREPSGLRPPEAERLTQIESGELPAGRDPG